RAYRKVSNFFLNRLQESTVVFEITAEVIRRKFFCTYMDAKSGRTGSESSVTKQRGRDPAFNPADRSCEGVAPALKARRRFQTSEASPKTSSARRARVQQLRSQGAQCPAEDLPYRVPVPPRCLGAAMGHKQAGNLLEAESCHPAKHKDDARS